MYVYTYTICNCIWQNSADNFYSYINSENVLYNSSRKLRFTFHFWDFPTKYLLDFTPIYGKICVDTFDI